MTLNFAIVWNTLLLAILLGAQVGARSISHGIKFALSNLDLRPEESVAEARLKRVKNNQLEFMVLLLSVLCLANANGGFPDASVWIPTAMVVGRTLYLLVALAGIPVLRSLAWIFAFAAWLSLTLPYVSRIFY